MNKKNFKLKKCLFLAYLYTIYHILYYYIYYILYILYIIYIYIYIYIYIKCLLGTLDTANQQSSSTTNLSKEKKQTTGLQEENVKSKHRHLGRTSFNLHTCQ